MSSKITLATLPQATAQEVFDQVATHLLTQNQKSLTTKGCAYRGENNLMCAAGCLISDEEYNHEMDNPGDKLENGTSWSELVDVEYAPPNHRILIGTLQTCHDLMEPHQWEDELAGIAIANGLEFKGEQYVRSLSSN